MIRKTMLLSACALLATAASAAPAPPAPRDVLPAPILGAKTASRTFIVWGSMSCPFTNELIPILEGIVADSSGTVKVEWHHFPIHKHDPAIHLAAMADPAKFWRVYAAVRAEAQKNDAFGAEAAHAQILAAAKAGGVPAAKVERALKDKELIEAFKQDVLAGKLLGVKMTPAVFYQGYFMTPEGLPLNTLGFDNALRTMLKLPLKPVPPAKPAAP